MKKVPLLRYLENTLFTKFFFSSLWFLMHFICLFLFFWRNYLPILVLLTFEWRAYSLLVEAASIVDSLRCRSLTLQIFNLTLR